MLTPLRRQWPAVLFENRYSTQQDINMIISHKHRFIFLKTRKTAGTSVECALSAVCGADDVLTPGLGQDEGFRLGKLGPRNYEYVPPLYSTEWPNLVLRFIRDRKMPLDYYNHMHAWRVRRRVSRTIWNSYYKFAFERNPWDRQVSFYFYKTRGKVKRPTFEQFIKRKDKAYVGNYDIYAIDGEIGVDFVGLYENVDQDFQKAMKEIGIKEKISLPKANVSKKKVERGYRQFFNDETRDRMAEWYEPEISAFGYKF